MTQRCATCAATLSYLVGDVTPYELIDPLEGGPKVLLAHTEERCRFHHFLTPELRIPRLAAEQPVKEREEVLAGSGGGTAGGTVGTASARPRWERWVRTDVPTG